LAVGGAQFLPCPRLPGGARANHSPGARAASVLPSQFARRHWHTARLFEDVLRIDRHLLRFNDSEALFGFATPPRSLGPQNTAFPPQREAPSTSSPGAGRISVFERYWTGR